ncbi:hypothetical protein BIY24_08900 [Halobacteriovorax marinus]|uniref:Fosfomycin resistance protein n=1 Tax=Halobacteriovorax marinus (strain ATCC BAA-682 / DSM 15412 / SJ) TaxID=862908 RepID=E1X2F0_HALMS|nr:VOC family protein [Halobacteriovorax marinus]ATH08066.1 hypothetical protein BIY24_08900 [Halobacteriovorax marinus]CBW26717.1 putative fosfomycin resistance protein [Halobacteriovorax marinus SJ]
MLEINAIDHINMNVLNFEESEKFYKKLFGMKVLESGQSAKSGNDFKVIGIPNKIALCLYETDEVNFETAPIAHFGINIDNYSEIENILKELNVDALYGGEILWKSSSSIYIKDPSGHEIELTKNFAGGL